MSFVFNTICTSHAVIKGLWTRNRQGWQTWAECSETSLDQLVYVLEVLQGDKSNTLPRTELSPLPHYSLHALH